MHDAWDDSIGGVYRQENNMHAMRKLNVAVLLWAFATGAALADTARLTADLQPSSEVPPTNSSGSGTLDAQFDSASKVLTWTITYQGLTGPATAAHFHGPAAVGVNAGPVIPIPKDGLASPIKGKQTLTDSQEAALMAGKWYFNVHTKEHPGGEIRGQIMPASK
jgi:hypothetical protein